MSSILFKKEIISMEDYKALYLCESGSKIYLRKYWIIYVVFDNITKSVS